MKLYIDSTDNSKTIIRLDGQEFVREVSSPRDQDVFGFMISCFEKIGKSGSEITEVEVNAGPGSFTGTRIGVSIANAIGYTLGVKVNGSNSPVDVIYSAPPSITLPKQK